MPQNEVKIVITGDSAKAIAATDKVESRTREVANKVKSHWLAVTASIAAAVVSLDRMWAMAEKSAKYEQSRNAFRSMVQSMGKDAETEFEKIRKASAGLIDNKSLTESANKALSLGIPLEKLSELMEIARAKSRDMGITTTQAFNDIATGIGRGSPLILDNLGLMLKLGDANERMAASLGKTVEQLTAKEQKMAILNATVDAGKEALERYNLEQLTTYERMQKLTATVENLRLVMGTVFIRVFAGVMGSLQGVAAASLKVTEGIVKIIEYAAKATDFFGITQGAAQSWAIQTEALHNAANELWGEAKDNFQAMIAGSAELNVAMKRTSDDGITSLAKSASNAKDKIAELNRHIQDLIDRETMTPEGLITKQADEWKKLGADRVKIEEWVNVELKKLRAQETDALIKEIEAEEKALLEEIDKRYQESIKKDEDYMQSVIDAYGSRAELEEKLTDSTASEQEKRLKAEEKVFEHMMRLDFLSAQSYEEYLKNKEEITRIYAERRAKIEAESAPKTFEMGITEGMDEYLKSLEWGFDRGKELSREAFSSMENFFEDLFVGKVKLSWESLLGWMGGLFAKFMAQVTTQMLAQSGNITGMLGGMGNILPGLGGTLGSIGIGGAIGMMGGQLFGGGTGANVGGIAGGIGGSLLNSAFTGSMFFSGGLLGSQLGTFIMPVIGTLLGAAIGFAVDALIGDDTIQQKFRVVGGEVHTYGDMSSKKEAELLETLQPLYDSFVDMAEKIGLEAADLFDIGRWGLEDQGKISSKELMNSFYRGLLDALGLDTEIFKEFQKDGEKYYETIARVMDALANGIPAVIESIDDYIGAIESSDDAIAQARRTLRDYDSQIAEIQDAFDAASDPSDQQQYALEVSQLLYEKYAYEKALILGIVATIRSLDMELASWNISMQQKIDGLTGSFDSIGMMWDRMSAIAGQLADTSLSAADRLQLLQEGVGWLDQWVAANIAAIQQQYEMQQQQIEIAIENINAEINALQAQKEAINEQISGLQEQLSLSRQWKSLLDSVNQSIRDMKTTYSQRDDLEQLDYLRSEIDALFGKYQGATGEEKIGYANELQNLIKQYLQLAGDTLQLPSLEYGKVYEDMLKILETIQADATEGSATEQDILAEIETLQQEANDIDEQIRQKQDEIAALNQQMLDLDKAMQADIQAFKDSAVVYYEWAQTEGARLIEEQKQMLEDQLGELVGDLGVDGYLALKQQETVDRLTDIQALLQGILDAFGNIPQSAEGAYFTRPSLTWVAERGPEWVIPDGQTGSAGGNVTVSLALSTTIHAGDNASPAMIARANEDQLIRSIRGGRLRTVIQDAAKGR